MEKESMPCSLVPGGFVHPASDSESDNEQAPYREDKNEKCSLFPSSRDVTDHGICQNVTQNVKQEHESTISAPQPEQSTFQISNQPFVPNSVLNETSPPAKGNCVPVTPTKPAEADMDPVTPTANLKILLSAASPDIRERDNRKKELFKDQRCWSYPIQESSAPTFSRKLSEGKEDQLSEEELYEDAIKPVSRKDKSLGLLCQRFLSRFPDYPDPNVENAISLDVVARDLSVERRRIYDIVNVLESVEIVSRLAKNSYVWHGKGNLLNTLSKLKVLGEKENYAEQIAHLKRMQTEKEFNFGEDANPTKESQAENVPWKFVNVKEVTGLEKFNNRKDKSLGVMSQKFIMLFLVSKTKVVSLDIAARILIGDINYEINENSKFKTKIRRLYDIANILTSLQLIKKVHVTETRGRKPAFKWIGIEPDNDQSGTDGSLNNRAELFSSSTQRPATKHSLLNQLPAINRSYSVKEGNPTYGRAPTTHRQSSFQRHASFQSMCEVVEREHKKLCSSAPSSPVKHSDKDFDAKLQKEFEGLKKSSQIIPSQLFAVGKAEEKRQMQGDNSIQSKLKDQTQKEKSENIPAQQHQEPQFTLIPATVGAHGQFMSSFINSNVGTLQTFAVPVSQINVIPGASILPTQTIVTVSGLQAVTAQDQTLAASANNAVNSQRTDAVPTRRSKRTIKQILSEEFEYPTIAKKSRMDVHAALNNGNINQRDNGNINQQDANAEREKDIPERSSSGVDEIDGPAVFTESNTTKQDAEMAPMESNSIPVGLIEPALKIRNRRRSSLSSLTKPSPLRALHNDPEFRISPSIESVSANSSETPSPVDGKFDTNDLDLAFPLNDENTRDGTDQPSQETETKDDQDKSVTDLKKENAFHVEKDEPKNDSSISTDSSQTSLLFSQSPFHLLLNTRHNSSSQSSNRPSSLSSIAELERVFGSCTSPPLLSPNMLPGKQQRSKSTSPSHFHSLVGSHAQQMSMPTVISPTQTVQPFAQVNPSSPAVIPQINSNLGTPSLLSSNGSPMSISPTLTSGNPPVFSFNLNQLLANATNMAQAKSPTVGGQPQQNIHVQVPSTVIHTPIPTAPVAMAQTPTPAVPPLMTQTPRSQTSVFLQQNSFIQSPFAQWSTPINSRGNGALLPGMSPIMPAEGFSPKTLTPGNTSYQNLTLTATPVPSTVSSTESTPISSVDFNSSSFFHTPNIYSMMSTGNLMQQHNQQQQHPTTMSLSAFQHVNTNQTASGVSASRRLVIPDNCNGQLQI
ncbi:uncharacterized protein [Ptychodera flava]|uniref:uncharacterized protein isoform X2 n=1 Tax=Ptychodera flava TaxID=63121 RepID=UPI00396A1739